MLISLKAYKEILKDYNIKGHELRRLLRQHKKEGCCSTCLEDAALGYDDLYPFCCCRLLKLVEKASKKCLIIGQKGENEDKENATEVSKGA